VPKYRYREVEDKDLIGVVEQLGVLHRLLLAAVRHDEVCRRLMTTPGVGEAAS
jgi:transposase